MRTLKQMELFTIFKWSDLAKDLTCDEYEAYEGVYKNIRNSAKGTDEPEGSGLADIDFETELIGTDTVNFDYIMGLLTVIRSVQPVSKRMEMLDKLLTDYEDGDDEVLKIQKELLKKYIEIAPRKEFSDILDAADSFIYFQSKTKQKDK